ncbi:hypothetical protein D3C71_1831090 [compost metagenome]
MLGPLQALVGTHDADIVPHETPQLVPVVRNDHVLVRVGHLAGIPAGQLLGHRHSGELGDDVVGGRAAVDETLEQ